MSRTDAHTPLWVRLVRGELAAHPVHAANHDQCDLPDHPGPSPTRCYWAFVYTGTKVCSCWMCQGGAEHRRENRRRRHRDRRELRAARPAAAREKT